jgi:hypothetical protein
VKIVLTGSKVNRLKSADARGAGAAPPGKLGEPPATIAIPSSREAESSTDRDGVDRPP